MNMKYLLACGVAAVSIGTAMADPKPTVFPHGIAGASNVMTSSGAVQGTLSDTVTKAQGSVQQTDIGSTVAPLDANKKMSAPVSGDSSGSPVLATGSTKSRNLADRAADRLNIKNYAAMAGGSSDVDAVQALRTGAGADTIIDVPKGSIWPVNTSNIVSYPTNSDPTNSTVIWNLASRVPVGSASSYLTNLIDVDNDLTIAPYNGSMTYSRHNKTAAVTRPLISLNMQNSSPNIRYDSFGNIGKMYSKTPLINLTATQDVDAVGSLAGLSMTLTDYGNNANSGYSNQVQGLDVSVNRYGQDATWGISVAMDDNTVTTPIYFAQTGAEIDMGGNGPEIGDPQVESAGGGRKNLWLGIGVHDWPHWAASTNYDAGTVISMNDTAGTMRLYKASAAGTSGASAVTWPTTGTVTDGTVTWTEVMVAEYEVAKAIFLDGNNYNHDSLAHYDHGLTSNAKFLDDFIDASQIEVMGNDFAALRMAPNMPIDFDYENTGATVNVRNQHTLFWKNNTYIGNLMAGPGLNYGQAYASNSHVLLGDDGRIAAAGVAYMATGTAGALSKTPNPSGGVTLGNSYYTGSQLEGDVMGGYSGLNLMAQTDNTGALPTASQLSVLPNVIKATVPFQLQETTDLSTLPEDNGYLVNNGETGVPYIFENGTWRPIITADPSFNVSLAGILTAQKGIVLSGMTKAAILAIVSPIEGLTVYDSDDHTEVTYRCPTTTTCGWFPVQYGTALSN